MKGMRRLASIWCPLLVVVTWLGGTAVMAGTPLQVDVPQTLYFLSPEGTMISVAPGLYAIRPVEGSHLELAPAGKLPLVIEAQEGSHDKTITAPEVALIPNPEEPTEVNLALWLPDGTGLEAVGSTTEVQSRGVRRKFRLFRPRFRFPGFGGVQPPSVAQQPPSLGMPLPKSKQSTGQDVELPTSLPEFVPNEVIVKLRPGMSLSPSTLNSLGIQRVQTTSGGEVLYRIVVPFGSELPSSPLAVVEQLKLLPAVEYAQPNYIVQHNSVVERLPFDPHFPHQWHYFSNGVGPSRSPGGIGLPKAWGKTVGSRSVIVSVVDTGIRGDHPDITGSGNLLAGFDMISTPASANDGDGRDSDATDPGDANAAGECGPGSAASSDSWHGTHVAGTVGAGGTNNGVGVAGVNWLVRVLPVRVLGKCGGTTVDQNDGIRWAVGLPVPSVTSNPNPARIINLSLAARVPCTANPSLQAAINDVVTKKGAIVVVAAGNNGINAALESPASCNNVITVAASDARGRLAPYSNWGNRVTVMAPGGDLGRDDNADGKPDGVLSLFHPGQKFPPTASILLGYALYQGTSMATPHVSGVVALWLASDPSLTFAEVRKRLKDNALPRTSTHCPRPCGAGLLNADLSLFEQVPVLWNNGKAYIFRGNRYARFDVASDKVDQAIRSISSGWPSMPAQFQSGIDAAVFWNNGKAYFFKGSQYVRWDVATDKADFGPRPIATGWPSLPTQFRNGIDAAVFWLPTLKAYFFKGHEYVRWDVTTDRVDKGPVPIKGNWKGLWPDGVDGAVLWPNGKAYFFKGNQYMRFDVLTDRVDQAPKRIKDGWKGLCDLVNDCP